ncbi:MAG: Hsp70 family protein, partial [Candidatus Solibacter sp.]|nr:Hsp70 family protein [Candidatus Solibacter sp.]
MKIRRTVGIDLGTTNSCVGVMNETQSQVILFETEAGSSTTPSCVWFDERSNEVVVGSDAYMRRGSLPAPVVSVKRSMGKLVLIPLGKAGKVPGNVPSRVKRALSETREDRLQRYLSRLEAANPEELEAVRQKKRAEPPVMWVMDQARRLQIYLDGLDDPRARADAQKDPPLLWLPEEISALILAEERRQILARQRQLEPENTHVVDRCLITVPAYFGAEQIEATKEAGTLAGLVVMDLLQEPSAAAVYYCWKSGIQNGLFLVFDLGGGTFDVSVLRRQTGWSGVLGISGDNLLGGDDFDRVLAEHIRLTILRNNPRCDLNLDMERVEDRRIWDTLVFMAEGVKKALSREPAYLLRDTNLCDRRGGRLNIDMKITRAQFEGLISPLIDKCIPKCWEAIGKAKLKAGVSLAEVDQIFLVGGATHVPSVQREVRRRLCGGEEVPYSEAE